MDKLSARNLAKHGLRRSAYDGGNRRRFCLFSSNGDGTEMRREFDSKRERDAAALTMLDKRVAFASNAKRIAAGEKVFSFQQER